MQTSVLIGAKNFGYFKIYGVSAQINRQRESIFHDLVQTTFMDNPLGYFKTTALLILALNLKNYLSLKCFLQFTSNFNLPPISNIFLSGGTEKSCSGMVRLIVTGGSLT